VDGTVTAVGQVGLAVLARIGAAKAPAVHSTDWGAVIAQVAIYAGIAGGVAAVIAVVPMTRNAVRLIWRATLNRAGVPYERYAKRFTEKWGTYRNPYLDEYEPIDLSSTYVPLFARQRGGQQVRLSEQQVQSASDILAGLPSRLVLIGDPGSGKSTVLAAEGMTILRARGRTLRRGGAVPFLIQLRDLASFMASGRQRVPGENLIASYIVDQVLDRDGFFRSRGQAAEFFARTVTAGKAVVMLDGLDEVAADRMEALFGAVDDFMNDGSADLPTRKAKIWLTCRSQNFAALRGNWIDTRFAPYDLYSLEPLRDADIVGFLSKFKYTQKTGAGRRGRRTFATAEGPGEFMDAIRERDRIDLLRVPLILAMAVGLYADRPRAIPSTIDTLYKDMIREMLDRHRFPLDRPGLAPLVYQTPDKYSFLQQFALKTAKDSGNFDDFAEKQLLEFAGQLADTLDLRGDPAAFVAEIIRHSGLLRYADHNDLFYFAHRSMQEFLAAQELRDLPDGEQFLLERAGDLNWAQTIQFHTAGRESRHVDAFLCALAKANPVLAVHCLKAARPSGEAARTVLAAIRLDSSESVSALAAATHSPQPAVRQQAREYLADAVMASDSIFSATGVGIDEMLPLLRSLASTDAAKIATMVPRMASALPDDPRLVGPLWRCLRAQGIEDPEHAAACQAIVDRLLRLATSPAAFEVLAAEDPGDHQFLARYRADAYPFERRCLPADHNLITLLAWADFLRDKFRYEQPSNLNRFFAAKAAGKLGSVEDARRQTVRTSFCLTARALSVALLLTAAGFAIAALVTHPGWTHHPFGWWTIGLMVGASALPWALLALHISVIDDLPTGWYDLGYSFNASGNLIMAILDADFEDLLEEWPGRVSYVLVAAVFAIAPAAFLPTSLVAYLLLAIGGHLLFWELDLRFFDSDKVYYLWRPNVFVDMYEDAKSKHWVTQPKTA